MRNHITFLLLMITFGHNPMWAKNPVAIAKRIGTSVGHYERSVQVAFDGSASYDPDGTIVKYRWYQIGILPTEMIFATPDKPKTIVAPVLWRLGVYGVVLECTDDDGGIGRDTVTVTVNNNKAPEVNAGNDQTLSFYKGGCVTATVNVAFKDPDGSVTSFDAVMPATPSGWTMLQSGQVTKIKFNKPGIFILLVTVKDNSGAATTDQVRFTVSEKPCSWWTWFTLQCRCR